MEEKSNNHALMLFTFCICISYLLPYHVHPFRAFYNDWIIMLGAVILLAFQVEQKNLRIRIPWIALIPLGLAVLIFLQTSFGMLTVSWDALLPLAYLIFASLVIAVGATLSVDEQGVNRLCNALVIGYLVAGLVSVGIATLQFIGEESAYGYFVMQFPHGIESHIRPFANVAQPNQLALLFCMSIASVWWLFQVGRIGKITGTLVGIVLLWGLVLTQSRIGWLILPMFAFFFWSWRQQLGFIRISPWFAAIYILLYAVSVLMLPAIAAATGSSVYSALDHVQSVATSDRLVLLLQALRISLAHPVFGAGWYEFGPQQVTIASAFHHGNYSQHAHNIFMNFAAEIGLPATVLIFGALSYWFYKACFCRPFTREIGFATLFFTAVGVHSMVEFPLWYAYVLLPTALLMGMVHQQQFGSRAIAFSRGYIVTTCMIMSLGLVAVAADYRRLVVGFRALGWENLGLKADEGTTKKPTFTVFPHFYDYFHFAKTTAHEGMRAEEIADMETVMRRFGYAPVLMRMSLIYALNNRPDDALKAMMVINKIHPAQYANAYQAWEDLEKSESKFYSSIFVRLPPPRKKPE